MGAVRHIGERDRTHAPDGSLGTINDRRARRNIAPRPAVIDRAKAAIRSMRPIAFAYMADRAHGG
ncbi:hypothetical protein CF640_36865 [Burkholderia pseudomallei]|nr:hypothetical protein CF640_36865 [Burkholderia pseudomallei]